MVKLERGSSTKAEHTDRQTKEQSKTANRWLEWQSDKIWLRWQIGDLDNNQDLGVIKTRCLGEREKTWVTNTKFIWKDSAFLQKQDWGAIIHRFQSIPGSPLNKNVTRTKKKTEKKIIYDIFSELYFLSSRNIFIFIHS